ncbi:unnamed protein product [Cuscuta epithymum]|uniref:CASP-like protein n=1 Tax=Cuscuta epithymum TaxID=186058 RepID=A0AAV0FPX3_9ASTE|nr:unnamed protein product [Cuscuta epithymum]
MKISWKCLICATMLLELASGIMALVASGVQHDKVKNVKNVSDCQEGMDHVVFALSVFTILFNVFAFALCVLAARQIEGEWIQWRSKTITIGFKCLLWVSTIFLVGIGQSLKSSSTNSCEVARPQSLILGGYFCFFSLAFTAWSALDTCCHHDLK